jgi:DNA-binding response OmpR family regulator
MSGESANDTPPVLLIEHDPQIARPLLAQLPADGYPAQLARTARHAQTLARAHPPALALLGDLEHPCAALALLAEIRGRGIRTAASAASPWPTDLPVIVISSRAQEADLLRAFDAGADDFLARPVRYLELRARLRALLKRATTLHSQPRIEVGPLAIDPRTHTVSLHGIPVALRRMEYQLLAHLASDPERVFTKEDLLRAVWRYASPGSTRTLDSHASRLRGKLHPASHAQWIVNVRGVGYRLGPILSAMNG